MARQSFRDSREWRRLQALRLARRGWKHRDIVSALSVSEVAISQYRRQGGRLDRLPRGVDDPADAGRRQPDPHSVPERPGTQPQRNRPAKDVLSRSPAEAGGSRIWRQEWSCERRTAVELEVVARLPGRSGMTCLAVSNFELSALGYDRIGRCGNRPRFGGPGLPLVRQRFRQSIGRMCRQSA
ncbi:hypothetical protein BH10PLA2_BH10PLA2_04390 [soil metagenome]